jgi:hypothetical protein
MINNFSPGILSHFRLRLIAEGESGQCSLAISTTAAGLLEFLKAFPLFTFLSVNFSATVIVWLCSVKQNLHVFRVLELCWLGMFTRQRNNLKVTVAQLIAICKFPLQVHHWREQGGWNNNFSHLLSKYFRLESHFGHTLLWSSHQSFKINFESYLKLGYGRFPLSLFEFDIYFHSIINRYRI